MLNSIRVTNVLLALIAVLLFFLLMKPPQGHIDVSGSDVTVDGPVTVDGEVEVSGGQIAVSDLPEPVIVSVQ